MVYLYTAAQFLNLGLEIAGWMNHQNHNQAKKLCRWHSHYAVSPETAAEVFIEIQRTNIDVARTLNGTTRLSIVQSICFATPGRLVEV